MALTYTEIEEQKNTRIFIFFAVVLLFYFAIAAILGNITKWFFAAKKILYGVAEPFLTQRELVYVILFALAAAVIHSIYSVGNSLSFINKNLNTQGVDNSDKYHERFKNIVDEVNVATGSKYKIAPMVIPTVAMNAFAISDHKKNAVMGVTEGLLSKLSRQQLQAVVAHEAGHIVSGDSLQTTIGCSLFGIYAAMLKGIRNIFDRSGRARYHGRNSGGIILFLLVVYIVLSVMQFFYNIIRLFVSRNREMRADAIAVRITRDPISLSEALYAISRGWRGLGYIDNNLESLFIINPAKNTVDEKEGFWADLFSTHPPVKKRIEALTQMAHADVNSVQERVISQERLRNAMREIPSEKKTDRWLLMDKDNRWQGPFTIPQMLLLGWVLPETRIKSLERGDIIQAKDEAMLKGIFSEKIKGLKVSSYNCPRCNQALVDEEYEGTVVKRCLFCGGALVEKEKMPRIIIRTEKGFNDRIKKMAELAQKEGLKLKGRVEKKEESVIKCPKCRATMLRNFYTQTYFVEVDRCIFCGLVWFDKNELEMVQYLIEQRKGG